eukprot:m51a1_g1149 hypothetical protein (570) ;mRNA; r:284274-286268
MAAWELNDQQRESDEWLGLLPAQGQPQHQADMQCDLLSSPDEPTPQSEDYYYNYAPPPPQQQQLVSPEQLRPPQELLQMPAEETPDAKTVVPQRCPRCAQRLADMMESSSVQCRAGSARWEQNWAASGVSCMGACECDDFCTEHGLPLPLCLARPSETRHCFFTYKGVWVMQRAKAPIAQAPAVPYTPPASGEPCQCVARLEKLLSYDWVRSHEGAAARLREAVVAAGAQCMGYCRTNYCCKIHWAPAYVHKESKLTRYHCVQPHPAGRNARHHLDFCFYCSDPACCNGKWYSRDQTHNRHHPKPVLSAAPTPEVLARDEYVCGVRGGEKGELMSSHDSIMSLEGAIHSISNAGARNNRRGSPTSSNSSCGITASTVSLAPTSVTARGNVQVNNVVFYALVGLCAVLAMAAVAPAVMLAQRHAQASGGSVARTAVTRLCWTARWTTNASKAGQLWFSQRCDDCTLETAVDKYLCAASMGGWRLSILAAIDTDSNVLTDYVVSAGNQTASLERVNRALPVIITVSPSLQNPLTARTRAVHEAPEGHEGRDPVSATIKAVEDSWTIVISRS